MTEETYRGSHIVDFHANIEIIDEKLAKKMTIKSIWKYLTDEGFISMNYSYFARLIKAQTKRGPNNNRPSRKNVKQDNQKRKRIGEPQGFDFKPLSREEAKTIFK